MCRWSRIGRRAVDEIIEHEEEYAEAARQLGHGVKFGVWFFKMTEGPRDPIFCYQPYCQVTFARVQSRCDDVSRIAASATHLSSNDSSDVQWGNTNANR